MHKRGLCRHAVSVLEVCTGTGAVGTPRGWGQCLRFHHGDGGQEYGVPVGMESTTHGDTAVCFSKFAAALAYQLYGANVLWKHS